MMSIEESGETLDRLTQDQMSETGDPDYAKAFAEVLADPANAELREAYADVPRQPGEPREARMVAPVDDRREYGGERFSVAGISRVVDEKTCSFAVAHGLKYSEALRRVLDADPALKIAYAA